MTEYCFGCVLEAFAGTLDLASQQYEAIGLSHSLLVRMVGRADGSLVIEESSLAKLLQRALPGGAV